MHHAGVVACLVRGHPVLLFQDRDVEVPGPDQGTGNRHAHDPAANDPDPSRHARRLPLHSNACCCGPYPERRPDVRGVRAVRHGRRFYYAGNHDPEYYCQPAGRRIA
ncbi:hypothetical protein GCM10009825_28930 [Arthrobacter humicola]|uniref:Uncharacterized protein n=1 Tax=Arthrobacter humicola TaxID=409291 RepID=A0ABP5L6K6_9MICC